MKLITLDFETYYSPEYGLKKLTTEEYIRDPRFEPLLMGYKLDDDKRQHSVVGKGNIQTLCDALDIENSMVLCHHAHFDGLILSHHFGHKPKIWLDTLSMARAIHGTEVGGSLKKLLEYYNVGITKGTEVVNALGKRLADFSDSDLQNYRRYCMDDVEGTYRIFLEMMKVFPQHELKHIDMLIRMFTEPLVELDEEMLREYAMTIQAEKMTMLIEAGVQLDEVMSNDKFADALRRLGVEPPMKVSPATGKLAYAFAKTDREFLELLEDEDVRVQTLVSARLGNKTTIEETRALRLASMATRGPACAYYKYAGAEQTMRVSGGDKTNFQNLKRGGTIRESIYAPEDA
jgi:DNA polymerase